MNDFNIEFAHIYADQEFGQEQVKSISRLNKVVKRLQEKKSSFVTVILIDEYSPIVSTLEEQEFLNKIEQQGAKIDFVAYESKLAEISDKLIALIPQTKLKTHKIKNKKVLLLETKHKRIGLKDDEGKYTCSLLIATWILVRFGIYETSAIRKLSNEEFKAKNLITILPAKYKETEQKVIDILEVTKYKNLIKKIEYEFF